MPTSNSRFRKIGQFQTIRHSNMLLLATLKLVLVIAQTERTSTIPTLLSSCEHDDDDDDDISSKVSEQQQQQARLRMNKNDHKDMRNDDECGLYLAPSMIPNAGLGVFTTKFLKRGDKIGNGDVAIPIVDQDFHMGAIDDGDRVPYFSPFEDYVWHGWAMGMQSESDDHGNPESVAVFWPGLDSAINCKIEALNTDPPTSPLWDDGNLHRSKDPGAGAFTPYHNGSTYTTVDIPPGGELFKYYGDSWFQSRSDIFGEDLLLKDEWKPAQDIVNAFSELSKEHFHHASSSSSSVTQADIDADLWNIVSRMPHATETQSARYLRALPPNVKDARLAAEKGFSALYQEESRRSIEELQLIGRCMDNIEPKPSILIPQAGRGGFATRFIPQGTILMGSPLLHIPHKDHFVSIYASYKDIHGFDYHVEPKEVVGKQLLVNYCWGHPKSTMMLCPYGSGIGYINHNQTLTNVKMQWSPDGIIGQQEEWLDKTIEDFVMDSEFNSGKVSHLGMDIVATRDIQEGEELFLNYGQEWEDAWNNHVRHWKPVDGAHEYQSASMLNKLLLSPDNDDFIESPIRDIYEQQDDPYPSNVEIKCHPWLSQQNHISQQHDDKSVDKNLKWSLEEIGNECYIEARHEQDDGTFLYDLHITEGFEKWLYGMKRNSFRFFDLPYTKDHNLKNAFRHEIGIPDDIFPMKWKNL